MTRKMLCWAFLFLFLVGGVYAEVESVLDVVPAGSVAVVYVPSLRALSDEVDGFAAAMVPDNPPQEILAQQLAGMFGAQFQSLDDLRSIGIDPGGDFAVFWGSPRLQKPSAVVHITSQSTIEQVLREHAGVGEEKEHKGLTYEKTTEGNVLFLDDIMVFSADEATCLKAIEVYQEDTDSIRQDEKFTGLNLNTDTGVNDIVCYLALDQLAATYSPLLSMFADDFAQDIADDMGNIENMEQADDTDPSSDEIPGSETGPSGDEILRSEAAQFGGQILKAEIDLGLWLVQQMKALGLTLSLDGTDIELRAVKQFVDGSPLTELLSNEPRELELIGQMPANSFFVMGAAYSSEYWQQINSAMLMGFTNYLEVEDKAKAQQKVKELLRVMEKLTKNMGDELAGAARFSELLFPDIVGVYEVDNPRWMMDEALKIMPQAMELYKYLGMQQMAEFAEKMEPAVTETYLGTEILHMEMPAADMMGQVPPEAYAMMPESWNMWYAPTDEHLVYAMSANTDAIKEQIDALSGAGGTFAQWLEDTELAEKAPKENNWIVFLSPIAGLKSAINIISETEPNIGMLGMFLEDIPSKFSIIASGSNLAGGHEFRLQISAGDFRELVGIIAMMSSM